MYKSHPKISIITVCLNSEKTISKTVHSVREQTYKNVEHIVKDGVSSDKTIEIVKETNPKAKIFCQKDEGIYDAMNQGFELASGDLILFLNSDDYLSDNKIVEKVASIFKNGSFDIIAGDVRIFSDRNRRLRYWRSHFAKNQSLTYYQLPHPGIFIKRSILRKLDPVFDPKLKYGSDLKQQLQLNKQFDLRVYLLNEIVSEMKHGGKSTNGPIDYILGFVESKQIYNEIYYSKGTLFAILKVLRKFNQYFFD